MPRTRDEKSFQEKRNQILDVAIQCFIESGFHGTGMAKICKTVGMSPGALYRYFPSKESMIEAIVEQERAETALLLETLNLSSNKAIGLGKLLVDAVQLLSTDRSYCQLSVEISAEAARNPTVAKIQAVTTTELLSAFVQAIKQGQAAGQIDNQLAPEATAQLLMMILDGFVGQLAVGVDWPIDTFAQQVERSVLKLLSPPERPLT